ncbi:thioredoxin family protein [Enterococcus sp. LJL98]
MKQKRLFIIILISIFIFVISCIPSYEEQKITPIVTANQIYNLKKEDSRTIIYFGRASCKYCELYRPVLQSYIQSANKNVYYFDTDKFRDSPQFGSILVDFNIQSVPSLAVIEDGKITLTKLIDINKDMINQTKQVFVN